MSAELGGDATPTRSAKKVAPRLYTSTAASYGACFSISGAIYPGVPRIESLASVAHEGKIWLIGGVVDDYTSSVLIYDIEADSWGTGPALPRAACPPRATTLDGEIYVTSDDGGSWIYRNAAWAAGPEIANRTTPAFACLRLG